MNEQIDLIWRILVTFEGLDRSTDSAFALTFMLLTVCVGVFFVVLDVCYYAVSGSSFLRLNHGRRTPFLFLVWPLGAGFVAWFGLALNVLQPTLLGCIAAAGAWKLIIDRAILPSLADVADADATREER